MKFTGQVLSLLGVALITAMVCQIGKPQSQAQATPVYANTVALWSAEMGSDQHFQYVGDGHFFFAGDSNQIDKAVNTFWENNLALQVGMEVVRLGKNGNDFMPHIGAVIKTNYRSDVEMIRKSRPIPIK